MIDPLIQERLQQLQPDYAAFVQSNFVTEAARQLSAVVQLDADQELLLGNGISLYLLLFLTEEELAEFIRRECHISPVAVAEIMTVFKAFLPQHFSTLQATSFTSITNEQPPVANNVPLPPLTPTPTIPATPSTPLETTAPEQTYSSTQSALLQETARTPSQPVSPRWESEV